MSAQLYQNFKTKIKCFGRPQDEEILWPSYMEERICRQIGKYPYHYLHIQELKRYDILIIGYAQGYPRKR